MKTSPPTTETKHPSRPMRNALGLLFFIFTSSQIKAQQSNAESLVVLFQWNFKNISEQSFWSDFLFETYPPNGTGTSSPAFVVLAASEKTTALRYMLPSVYDVVSGPCDVHASCYYSLDFVETSEAPLVPRPRLTERVSVSHENQNTLKLEIECRTGDTFQTVYNSSFLVAVQCPVHVLQKLE